MPNEDGKEILFIHESDMTFTKPLGEGQFGRVSLYVYNGNTPDILNLTTTRQAGGLLMVKEFKEGDVESADAMLAYNADKNEKNNIQYLVGKQKPHEQKHYPDYRVVKAGNKELILGEIISYGVDNENKLQTSDMEKFMQGLAQNMNFKSANTVQMEGLQWLLQGFMASIVRAQHQLNMNGMLHLDTACRNFMITMPNINDGALDFNAKIIDLGLSHIMNAEGKYHTIVAKGSKLVLPLLYMSQNCFLPEKIKDADGNEQIKREFSIHSDIFSRKVATMEMLAFLLGKKLKDFCQLDASKDWQMQRKTMNDTQVLQSYFSKIKELVNALENNDMRKIIVSEFINNYQAYLTTMPTVLLTVKEMLQSDLELFNSASNRYRDKLKNESIHTPAEMMAAVMPGVNAATLADVSMSPQSQQRTAYADASQIERLMAGQALSDFSKYSTLNISIALSQEAHVSAAEILAANSSSKQSSEMKNTNQSQQNAEHELSQREDLEVQTNQQRPTGRK